MQQEKEQHRFQQQQQQQKLEQMAESSYLVAQMLHCSGIILIQFFFGGEGSKISSKEEGKGRV